MHTAKTPIKVFISYAHDDEIYFKVFTERLRKKLKNSRKYDYSVWDDRQIEIGNDWFENIREPLLQSDLCFLLLSESYFASDFIRPYEFLPKLEQVNEEQALIAPLLLVPADISNWEDLAQKQIFAPKGQRYGQSTVEDFAFADLVTFFDNGTIKPNPNLDRYVGDLMQKVETTLDSFIAKREKIRVAQKPNFPQVSFEEDKLTGLSQQLMQTTDPQSRSAIMLEMQKMLYQRVDIAFSFPRILNENLEAYEISQIRDVVQNPDYKSFEKTMLVGALTLRAGRPKLFDERIIGLLKDFVMYGEDKVWQRALTGLVLGLLFNSEKLNDRSLLQSLENLKSISRVQEGLVYLAAALYMHAQPAMDSRQMLLKQMFVSKRLMQFNQKKFWQEPQHWFLAFDPEYPGIRDIINDRERNIGSQYVELLSKSITVSDSQKYTVLFETEMQTDLSVFNLKQIFSQENAEVQARVSSDDKEAEAFRNIIYRLYLKDLDMFYQLYPQQKLKNILEGEFQLLKSELWEYISIPETRKITEAEIWIIRGRTIADLDDHETAIEAYEKALKLTPDYYAIWYNMGLSQSHLGKHQEAIDAYQKSLVLNAAHISSYVNIGFTYLMIGNLEQAKLYSEKALEVGRDGNAFQNLGHVFLCEGDLEKAEVLYEKSYATFVDKDEFFSGMRDDFEYLKPHGVKLDQYEKMYHSIGMKSGLS